MSNGIRGRPPGQGPTIPQPLVEEKSTKETTAAKNAQAPVEAEEPQQGGSVDKFERGGAEAGALNRLQQLVGTARPGGPKLQFTNEDLRYLAQQFASIIAGNPGANRAKKAKLFAAAILKRKKLKKLFGHLEPQQMDEMCDAIGNLLDSSPKFGQLVDDVGEEAGKMNS